MIYTDFFSILSSLITRTTSVKLTQFLRSQLSFVNMERIVRETITVLDGASFGAKSSSCVRFGLSSIFSYSYKTDIAYDFPKSDDKHLYTILNK